MMFIVFTLLLHSSITLGAFTQKDNILKAYDCNSPRKVEDRTLNDRDLSCDLQHKAVNVQHNMTYQLLVQEHVQRFKGWRCKILDTRNVQYCGNYDHQTMFDRYKYVDFPAAPSVSDCRKMVEERKYTDPNGKKHDLNVGGVTMVYYEEIGQTWATGVNPDETSEIQCQGGTWEIQDMSLTDMIVSHNLKVMVVKEEFRFAEGQVVAMTEGERLRCPMATAQCQMTTSSYF